MPAWPLLAVTGLVLVRERERERKYMCLCVRALDSGYVGVDLKGPIRRWELYASLGTWDLDDLDDLALSCPGISLQ